jgi:hypothetical protein
MSRWKEIKIRAEVNEMESKRTILRVSVTVGS